MNYWLSRAPGLESEGPFTINQLRKMHEAGTVTAVSVVCGEGEEEWISLDAVLAENEAVQPPIMGHETSPPARAYLLTSRVKTGGSGCAALFLFLAGLAICGLSLAFFLPGILVGLIVMALAFVADGKYGHQSTCGRCGNAVAKTSKQCPNCKSLLSAPPVSQRLGGWVKEAVTTVLVILVIAAVVTWIVIKLQPQ